MSDRVPTTLRRFLFGILVIGLLGTGTELVLLAHYEDGLQLVPLALIALGIGSLTWHAASHSLASLRSVQIVMGLSVVSGLIGVALHYQGAAEFQLEIDPTQAGWSLLTKVVHAKAPPILAPGAMVQLGLLGLAYGYRGRSG